MPAFAIRKSALSAAVVLLMAGTLTSCQKTAPDEIAAAQESKNPKDALIHLKNAAAADPKNAQARFLLGQQLMATHEIQAAAAEFKRALDLKYPPEELARPLADALLLSAQPALVLELVAPLPIKDGKTQASVLTSIAWAHLLLHDMPTARLAVDKADAAGGPSSESRLIRARMADAAGNAEQALKLIDELVAADPRHDGAWLFKGQLHERLPGGSAPAFAAYTKALAINPTNYVALASSVGIQILNKDYKAARLGLDGLRKLDPKAFMTYYHDGQLKFIEGNYTAARVQFQSALNLAPESTIGLLASGQNELKLKSFAFAESQLARVVQLEPANLGARFYLSRAYLAQGKPEQATATLTPLLSAPNPLPEVLLVAAQARLLQGDPKGADALLARASKLHGDHPSVQLALALTNLSKGNIDAGIQALERISASSEDSEADMQLINARILRNEYPAALAAIQTLERKQPESPTPFDLRGQVLLKSGDKVEARKAFETALKKDPQYLLSVANLATLDVMEGKPDQARQRLEEQVKRDPSNPAIHLALVTLGQYTHASSQTQVAELDKAIRADPRNVRARLLLIEQHNSAGDSSRALEAARSAIDAIPDNATLYEALAKSLARAGDSRQALATYLKLARIAPTEPAGYLGQANLLIAAKDPAGAVKVLQQLLAFAPANLDAKRLTAAAAMQQKQPDKALAVAREIQRDDPTNPLGFAMEGDVQLVQKRWDSAAAAYRSAMTKADGDAMAPRLHTALVSGNKPDEARQMAADWIKQHPKNPLLLRHLGGLAYNAGDSAQAKSYYEKVLDIAPKDAAVLNNLAWILVEAKDPKALAIAERAAAEAPENPNVLDTLAQAYAVNNDYAKAIETLRRAILRAAEPNPLRLRLARLYLAANDRDKAKAELESLRDLGRSFAEYAEVRKLLGQIH